MGNLTVKESGAIASFASPYVKDITSLKVNFSPVQEGSGEPSLDNIRPIKGWDGIHIERSGKNLIRPRTTTTTNGLTFTVANDGSVHISGELTEATSTLFNCVFYSVPLNEKDLFQTGVMIKYGGCADGNAATGQKYWDIYPWDVTVNARPKKSSTSTENAVSCYYSTDVGEAYIPAGHKFRIDVRVFKNCPSGLANGLIFKPWIILYDDNEEPFEKPQREEINISWSNGIGTVYGGTLDVITGELVAEYEYMTDTWGNWGTLSDCGDGTELRYKKFTNAIVGNSAGKNVSYCNVAKYSYNNENGTIHFYNVASSNNCRIYLPSGTDESLQIQAVGKLVEPIHYQLTPQQLSTFKGQNNFWSNADSVEIEYELTETFDIQEAKRKIILNQPHVESISGDIATFNTDMIGKLKECKINFLPVQEGEGDPSPENVREIVGWNGITIKKCGKNLLNPALMQYSTSATSQNWGRDRTNNKANGDLILPVGTYTLSITGLPSKPTEWRVVDSDGNYLVHDYGGYLSRTFTLPKRMAIGIYMSASAKEDYSALHNGVMLEAGSIATKYEPYTGQTYPITFSTEAGTIYGGYIDLIKGELVQEWKKVYIKDYTWSNYTAKLRYYISLRTNNNDNNNREDGTIIYSDTLTPRNDGRFTLADVGYITYYKQNTTSNISNRNYIWTTLPEAMERDDANEWIKTTYPDASIVYKLETPIIYQLTPQQLTTLRGINNIWSSANGEVEIKFWTH